MDGRELFVCDDEVDDNGGVVAAVVAKVRHRLVLIGELFADAVRDVFQRGRVSKILTTFRLMVGWLSTLFSLSGATLPGAGLLL